MELIVVHLVFFKLLNYGIARAEQKTLWIVSFCLLKCWIIVTSLPQVTLPQVMWSHM